MKLFKKKIAVATIVFIFILAGCDSIQETGKTDVSDMTMLERIEAAETFDEITDCRSRSDHPETEEEKAAFSEKILSYVFSDDNKLNGVYFYTEQFMTGTAGADAYGTTSSDARVICAVNREEIYIVPISYFVADEAKDMVSELLSAMFEKELDADTMLDSLGISGIEIADIAEMNGMEQYLYKAVSADGCDTSWNSGVAGMSIDVVGISNSDEITLEYCENDGYMIVYGLFQDQVDENGNAEYAYGRTYYLDPKEAENAGEEKHAADVAKREEQEQLKQSAPEVGMSADEVRQSAWGEPDDINNGYMTEKAMYIWKTVL